MKRFSPIIIVVIACLTVFPMLASAATSARAFTLVSHAKDGIGGDSGSDEPDISGDGRYVVFNSWATDMIEGVQVFTTPQVYLWDRQTGEITLVSANADGNGSNGYCDNVVISQDGSTVVFHSASTDLVEGIGETLPGTQIYRYDVASKVTHLVSKNSVGAYVNGYCYAPSVSEDGSRISYRSTAEDVAGAPVSHLVTGVSYQTFLYDVNVDSAILVTKGASGVGANARSGQDTVALDGSYVAFASWASDLVGAETSVNQENVFLYEVATGQTMLVTAGESGTGDNDEVSFGVTLSPDNQTVYFVSRATDIIPGFPTNNNQNLFAWNALSGNTELITLGANGDGGNDRTYRCDTSANGKWLTFQSAAGDLIAGQALTPFQWGNTFRYNLETKQTELIGLNIDGDPLFEAWRPKISSNGRSITFVSADPLIVDWPLQTSSGYNVSNVWVWDEEITLEVTFDAQNGTTAAVVPIPIDTAVSAPTDPTRAGFVFDGWWTQPTGGTRWDFSTPIESDMTLYAHWLELFTVTYDAQNGHIVTVPDVVDGSTLTEPVPPTKQGYTFAGWWTTPTGGTQWVFATDTVTGNMTLYAHWTKNVAPPGPNGPPTDIPPTGDMNSFPIGVVLLLLAIGAIYVGTRRGTA